jgi:proteasome lid subunit RPN8/RPN11
MRPLMTPRPSTRASRWHSPYERGGLQPIVSVFMSQVAYSRICIHSESDLENEVGGILVGQWCLGDEGEEFVVVEHALPAHHTRHGNVFLTFTQDSFVDLHRQIETNHKGQRILGWYHTHPHMGVFLSQYDTWLHGNFFPEPWQVALVVEPVEALGGFFVRQDEGLLDPTRYFGFYELDGSFGRSMMRWANLSQDSAHSGDEPE